MKFKIPSTKYWHGKAPTILLSLTFSFLYPYLLTSSSLHLYTTMLLAIFECSHFSEDSTLVICAFVHVPPSPFIILSVCQGPIFFFFNSTSWSSLYLLKNLSPSGIINHHLAYPYFYCVAYSFIIGITVCLYTSTHDLTHMIPLHVDCDV